MHALIQEVNVHLGYVNGDAHPIQYRKRLYHDFYAGCRSPERRELQPFSTALHLQQQASPFKAYQCTRLMALIEITDVPFWQLPYSRDALLTRLRHQRQNETCDYQVLSEMIEQAIQRLVSYSRNDSWPQAVAQFLKIKGTDTEREEQLTGMVHNLVTAFEKEGIDVMAFKPNHFATLSIFHARFLKRGDDRPQNGLNRWCYGLRAYIVSERIEPAGEKREHLASQCLPLHYDGSGVAQPAGLNEAGKAIATAPVTCELCHVGLAGHDKLQQHCRRKHGSLSEYRKRVFQGWQ